MTSRGSRAGGAAALGWWTARVAWSVLAAGVVRTAAAQGPSLPPPERARLSPRRDSLVALAATGVVGYLRMQRGAAADGGVRYTEALVVEDLADLTTLLVVDSAFVMRRLVQTGDAWGAEVAVSLQVDDGRLAGVATQRGGRIASVEPRRGAAPSHADLNAVPLLVAATPWTATARGTWRVFDAAQGQVLSLEVAVEALEPATGGQLATWRIAVRLGETVTRYRVTAGPPYRLLSVATDGQPFRFVAP